MCCNTRSQFTIQLQLQETVFSEDVHSVMVVIAFVIVLKCLPEEWRIDFLWDAWLAVTI